MLHLQKFRYHIVPWLAVINIVQDNRDLGKMFLATNQSSGNNELLMDNENKMWRGYDKE